ncbi:hypothetical protein [Micromonospora deserti]|uniref:Lipoprotein n=1 Tax=Micromonospora deserti TaxID=2070366 RepID=A0A2W2CWY8_9ACTN|nr:hypothetical protein [Micromonospora deserti]PZG02441.1 hypothetical protein C1I99_02365 [Micromonospora deserti]
MDDRRRREHTAGSGLVLLAAWVVAGCSVVDEPPAGSRSPHAAVTVTASGSVGTETSGPGPVVPCSHDLGVTTPPNDEYRLVLDAVAVPTKTLAPRQSGEPDWLFAKQGLVVRAGTPVEIMVAPEAVTRARIGWGSPGPEGTTIHVPACPSGSGWVAFAGGYAVRTPTCVPLIVRAQGRQERFGVGVGADC